MSDTKSASTGLGPTYVAAARRRLAACHKTLTHCLSQLNDQQIWWRPRESMNSIGNIILHLCGNIQQWIVSSIGSVPDARDRPGEFAERGPIPKDELLQRFATVVAKSDALLTRVDETLLLEKRTIQSFDETVLSAIFDCLAHLNGHSQEVVYITRLQLGDAYKFAWVPTPEQGGSPAAETVALRDATFARMKIPPQKPAVPESKPEAPPDDTSSPPASKESPLGDYLRDLEQEFQDEQDEGKLL